jgi:hypothetical protein
MTKDEICGLLRQIHDVLAMQSETNQVKPVAWLEPEWGEAICPEVGYEITMTDDHPRDLGWTPLYAHPPHKIGNIGCLGMPVNVPVTPPQRTWVGLTDEEVDEIYTFVQLEVNDHWDKGGTTMMFPLTLYKAIEAKLKEKNT